MPNHRRSKGFTLVELLVVIGIIALLISILLPSLSKARESANKVKCLSNIRQVTMAFIAYTADNKGAFPFMSLSGGSPYEQDWIWWQATNNKIDDIAYHGIGPYLNLSKSAKVMHCPSDDAAARTRNLADPYTFSYVLNNTMTSAWINTIPSLHAGGSWGGIGGSEDLIIASKITQVQYTAEKIMIFEEDERTIDDGNGSLYCVPAHLHYLNMLALRHDPEKRRLTDVPRRITVRSPTKTAKARSVSATDMPTLSSGHTLIPRSTPSRTGPCCRRHGHDRLDAILDGPSFQSCRYLKNPTVAGIGRLGYAIEIGRKVHVC